MQTTLETHRAIINRQIRERNTVSAAFFAREAARLARVSRLMAERFLRGGRLLTFGSGAAASDAQHIAVEFVHPVLVGKRALPALDLSAVYRQWLPVGLRSEDIVIGLGPPAGDPDVERALQHAAAHGALAFGLPGDGGHEGVTAPSPDPFIHQEMMEIAYHTLWETVHVFLERQALGYSGGTASFLYPFLGGPEPLEETVISEVAASILSKAACDEHLRDEIAASQGEAITEAALTLRDRAGRGGAVWCFGNGGSATDATDFAMDLTASPKGHAPVAAHSLAAEPATLTALANDVGVEAVYVRQLAAHCGPNDIAVAFSTSGGSANIVAALVEARARGLATIAFLGYDGGEILRQHLADHAIVVSSDQIPRIQEIHASMYHVLLDVLDAVRNRM